MKRSHITGKWDYFQENTKRKSHWTRLTARPESRSLTVRTEPQTRWNEMKRTEEKELSENEEGP